MLSMVVLNKFTEDINKIAVTLQELINTFKDIKYYVFNPVALIGLIWGLIVKYSKSVCLIVCFVGFLMYLVGIKKGAKVSMSSIIAYMIIKIFSVVI